MEVHCGKQEEFSYESDGNCSKVDDLGRVVVPKESGARCGSGRDRPWKFIPDGR